MLEVPFYRYYIILASFYSMALYLIIQLSWFLFLDLKKGSLAFGKAAQD